MLTFYQQDGFYVELSIYSSPDNSPENYCHSPGVGGVNVVVVVVVVIVRRQEL